MKGKEIEKARISLRNAGTLSDRNQLRAALIAKAGKDVETLGHGKETIKQDFRRKLERWETREIPDNVAVCAIPSDVHDSRIYRVTAIFALLAEVGLAAWIFQALGVPWWLGLVAALLITSSSR